MNLFRCGHVQQIQVTSSQERLFISANCLPEMIKDRVHKIIIVIYCQVHGGSEPVASCIQVLCNNDATTMQDARLITSCQVSSCIHKNIFYT